MFSLLALLVFLIFSTKAMRLVWRQSEAYREFGKGVHRPLMLLALLPFGPLVLIAMPHFVGSLPASMVAIACFAPAAVAFHKHVGVFDRSGTSRTHEALRSAQMGFAVALVGILYVGAFLAFSITVATI